MPKVLKDCVKGVQKSGKSEKSAYAICMARLGPKGSRRIKYDKDEQEWIDTKGKSRQEVEDEFDDLLSRKCAECGKRNCECNNGGLMSGLKESYENFFGGLGNERELKSPFKGEIVEHLVYRDSNSRKCLHLMKTDKGEVVICESNAHKLLTKNLFESKVASTGNFDTYRGKFLTLYGRPSNGNLVGEKMHDSDRGRMVLNEQIEAGLKIEK